MGYVRRLLDDDLDSLLPELPAIALDGPKGVGKTATALQRAATVFALDEAAVSSLVQAEPERVVTASTPVLIDEWQRVPEVWDQVRRAVDDGAEPGSFLLTGSATPPEDVTIHSGAGRILSLRMRPLALPERGLIRPTVSLAQLLAEPGCQVAGESTLRLADYATEIDRSGFPGLRGLSDRARRMQLDSYLTRALSRDLTDEHGITVRRPDSLRAWLTAYAAATSTTSTWEVIRRAASPGDADPPTKVTTIRYRDWLTALWLLDPVPAWRPSTLSLKGLAEAPKHHLADPALACRLLRLSASSMLDGEGRLLPGSSGTALGALFESLATLTVRVCAQSNEATVHHLRTDRGTHEVDLIVESHDGRVVAFEVKLAQDADDQAAHHLKWLQKTYDGRVSNLVVLTTGQHAYRRRDGVAVVPLALLGR